MSETNILELRDIVKFYPGVVALNKVSIGFRPGEIHAIVGENGAGKSTLIKCITGCIEPSDGEIVFQGKTCKSLTPIEAIERGIGAVYQEFNLVPFLSAAENIFYGREKRKKLFLDHETMNREAKAIIEELGISIDPKTRVKDLTVAYQQMVEIAKTVSREVKFLILDEPSAPLTPPEIESMFAVLRRLKQKGVTILYISHRMEEIFQIADRVTVLRDGLYISTLNTAETDRNELIRLMVGRELSGTYPKRTTDKGEVVLKVKDLCSDYIKDVSFELEKGEILGLGGLVGAGRTETVRAIFGADPLTGGEIFLNGKSVRVKSPKEAIKHGIGLIPEDRKRHGVLQGLSVKVNVSFACLPVLSKRQWIESRKENGIVKEQITNLQIKTPSESQLVKNLSGGNQQKIVLAKWLATKCDVLIFDEPTRGIDVGAKQEIYKLMRSLAEQGKSIIMISSEMPELLGMSDRIVVMHEGRIMGELDPWDATQETVLAMASNL
ncbi:MAG: sugar ABC transporter ATP-binding protein [Treponema sp.]|jgi:ribose transport system ATP-binding protein|nr:sugar ABC transporter ATP-binding protein [Treponema sp.]